MIFVCVFTFCLLIVIILTFVMTRTVRWEYFSPQDTWRFQFYTRAPKKHTVLKNSLNTLLQKFPFEFSHKDYTLLDFPRCTELFNTPPSSLPFPHCYIKDLFYIWKALDSSYKKKKRYIVWYPHDRVEAFSFPVIVKTRPIHSHDQHGSILFKLNTGRHFDMINSVYKKDPMMFDKKKPSVIWRGSPTGYGFGNNIPHRPTSRETLVKTFFSSSSPFLDIGLVLTKKQRKTDKYKKYIRYEKPQKTLKELLSYKYILSIEGNDVASNLKWAMSSNSVVIMPKPRICSWFLESMLKPYIHYIPVHDDFHDLEHQVKWAEKNPQKCKDIIRNAHAHIEIFLEQTNERVLLQKILKYYLDNFEWS